MEKICEGADTSAISRRLRMIGRHHRVKDLGGASGFLPITAFILLILSPEGEKFLHLCRGCWYQPAVRIRNHCLKAFGF